MRTLVITKEHGTLDYRATLDAVTLWLQTCANGKYTISMKKVQETRSNQQNKIMWVWFNLIAKAWTEATGRVFTKDDVYNIYCLMFLPIDTPRGRAAGSTSSLTQEQMSEFLDAMNIREEDFDADSETVGGWTIESFGRFPKTGESVRIGSMTVTVLAMDDLRVERVLVRKDPEEEEPVRRKSRKEKDAEK